MNALKRFLQAPIKCYTLCGGILLRLWIFKAVTVSVSVKYEVNASYEYNLPAGQSLKSCSV